MNSLGRALGRLWFRIIWRWSVTRTLHGIRVAVFEPDNAAQCFDRLDAALGLIARYDPTTFESIRKHFAGVLVFGIERYRAAHWNENAHLCVITYVYVQSATVRAEDVALTLVHENMHARLDGAGVEYKEGRRAPIEVLCAMAELAFARRLPLDRNLAQRVEGRVEEWARRGEESWSDRAKKAAKLEHLRQLGTPRWIVALVDQVLRIVYSRAA